MKVLKLAVEQEKTDKQIAVDELQVQLRESSSKVLDLMANVERLTASLSERSDKVEELREKLSRSETELKEKVSNVCAYYRARCCKQRKSMKQFPVLDTCKSWMWLIFGVSQSQWRFTSCNPVLKFDALK